VILSNPDENTIFDFYFGGVKKKIKMKKRSIIIDEEDAHVILI
jgi:hypothetical protein